MSDMLNEDGFFPPPWNINDYPEKTLGWIEFQKAMRADPQIYRYAFEDMLKKD